MATQKEFLGTGGFKTVSQDDFLGGGGFKVVEGDKPTTQFQPSQKSKFRQGVQTLSDGFELPLSAGGNFLFGATKKTVGGLIVGGVESAQTLAGKPPQERRGLSVKPGEGQKLSKADAAFTLIETYPGGGFVRGSLKKIPGGAQIAKTFSKSLSTMSTALRASAVKQFSQALGATKEVFKRKTEKVVPELLERGVVSGTRGGLLAKAEQARKIGGEAIDEFINKLPDKTKVIVKPIIETFERAKQKYIVDGKVIEKEAVQAIDDIEKVIAQFGDKIPFKSLRKIRMVWDDVVSKTNKPFTETATTLKNEARRIGGNSVREELAKTSPDLAKLNKEFSFWKNVEEIVDETIKRTTPQATALSQRGAQAVGFISGVTQGSVKLAVLTGVALKNLIKFTQSTLWRTVSANTKNKMANWIIKGEHGKLNTFILKTMSATRNITKTDRQE